MIITWLGQSCFLFEQDGYRLVIDPYFDGSVPGLKNMRETTNKVLCSHGHKDHSGIEMVKIIEKNNCPFLIKTIDTYHDNVLGEKRGKNKIHIIKSENEKIVHLGDLGCDLTKEQIALMMDVDFMLIPVGGYYTIDAKQAKKVVEQCNPKKVIPMHYKSEKNRFGYDVMSTVDEFVSLMDSVRTYNISQFDTKQPAKERVIIMLPRNLVQ